MTTPMTTVTFDAALDTRSAGGYAADALKGLEVRTRVELTIPTEMAARMGLVVDRAAMYAALFGGE